MDDRLEIGITMVDGKYIVSNEYGGRDVFIFDTLPEVYNQIAAIDAAGRWVAKVKDEDFTVDPPS